MRSKSKRQFDLAPGHHLVTNELSSPVSSCWRLAASTVDSGCIPASFRRWASTPVNARQTAVSDFARRRSPRADYRWRYPRGIRRADSQSAGHERPTHRAHCAYSPAMACAQSRQCPSTLSCRGTHAPQPTQRSCAGDFATSRLPLARNCAMIASLSAAWRSGLTLSCASRSSHGFSSAARSYANCGRRSRSFSGVQWLSPLSTRSRASSPAATLPDSASAIRASISASA